MISSQRPGWHTTGSVFLVVLGAISLWLTSQPARLPSSGLHAETPLIQFAPVVEGTLVLKQANILAV